MINLNEKPLCTIPRVMCWAVDNLELLKLQPNESVDLIYSDILYGTGRKFKDYQDLKPKRDVIESHYLPRLIEMKRVLKQNSSIYLQMDTRINHWMRILMDKVFGYDNFQNEIVWEYYSIYNGNKCFAKLSDRILFYSLGETKFNLQYKPYSDESIKRLKRNPSKKIDYRNSLFDAEFIINRGKKVSDVWTDIPMIKGGKKYPTQKPKELIKRFVLASSNENDVVADYYLGSGTTAEVCKELNRNFIGCDINPNAIELTKTRLNAGT